MSSNRNTKVPHKRTSNHKAPHQRIATQYIHNTRPAHHLTSNTRLSNARLSNIRKTSHPVGNQPPPHIKPSQFETIPNPPPGLEADPDTTTQDTTQSQSNKSQSNKSPSICSDDVNIDIASNTKKRHRNQMDQMDQMDEMENTIDTNNNNNNNNIKNTHPRKRHKKNNNIALEMHSKEIQTDSSTINNSFWNKVLTKTLTKTAKGMQNYFESELKMNWENELKIVKADYDKKLQHESNERKRISKEYKIKEIEHKKMETDLIGEKKELQAKMDKNNQNNKLQNEELEKQNKLLLTYSETIKRLNNKIKEKDTENDVLNAQMNGNKDELNKRKEEIKKLKTMINNKEMETNNEWKLKFEKERKMRDEWKNKCEEHQQPVEAYNKMKNCLEEMVKDMDDLKEKENPDIARWEARNKLFEEEGKENNAAIMDIDEEKRDKPKEELNDASVDMEQLQEYLASVEDGQNYKMKYYKMKKKCNEEHKKKIKLQKKLQKDSGDWKLQKVRLETKIGHLKIKIMEQNKKLQKDKSNIKNEKDNNTDSDSDSDNYDSDISTNLDENTEDDDGDNNTGEHDMDLSDDDKNKNKDDTTDNREKKDTYN